MSFHICFISPGLYKYVNKREGEASGGAERQQYMISSELRDRGHDVSMIVGDHGQPPHEHVNGIEVWNGCPDGIDAMRSLPGEIIDLFRTLRQVDADVYYVRGAPRLAALVMTFTTVLNKRLVFCIANESDLDPEYLRERYGRPFYLYYKRVINGTGRVITQTNKQQRMLEENFGTESIVVPNSYDLPPKSEVSDHDSREFVLWVGRSNENKKKPVRYLELARQLPEIEFVMVAQPSNDGTHHAEVQAASSSISNLEFVDTVAPDKIHRYYNRATLLVNTSDYEGFPNTYLEAWRYETPVVSLYHELDDVFATEEIGIRSGSMDVLVTDVRRIHSEVQRRREMGRNGREYLKNNYLLENIIDQYEDILERFTAVSN